MLAERGLDIHRTHVSSVESVEQFRTLAAKFLDNYHNIPVNKRKPLIMALDSLGQLSTLQELKNALEDNNKKDMTRTQVIRSAFRVITLKMSRVNVPFLVTNHAYETQDTYSELQMGGGKGLWFSASSIVFLSKRKDKDGSEVIGNVIPCKLRKGRETKENSTCETLLSYRTGLSRYYGLTDIAINCGFFKKLPQLRIPYEFISTNQEKCTDILKEKKVDWEKIKDDDGEVIYLNDKGKPVAFFKNGLLTLCKVVPSTKVDRDPEKYFTKEVMERLNKEAKKCYLYGSALEDLEDDS